MPRPNALRTKFEHANPILSVADLKRSLRYYVEALYEEYKDSGAQILQPPETFPWACEMKVGDPDGHVLRFGSDPKDDA